MAQCKIKDAGVLDGIAKFIYFCKHLHIVKYIKIISLTWAGHITRMEEERTPPPKKKVLRFLMVNVIVQDKWENQEQDGRALF
jgi:hypothetical protein